MIKSLKIQNFQSHEKAELEFSPGVNIIVGSTDSGKTAIIRALRWLIWNRPSGDSIRSHWGGETSVTLGTENGTISRSKDKIDTYVLVTAEGKEFTFKAFGTSVPEEIQMFLNIGEINLQRQSDAPFLFSETPGNVAQRFNKIAKLDKIDIGIQNVNSWIRELTTTIGVEAIKDKPATGLIKQIADTEKELMKYAHLEKAEIDLDVLEKMDGQLRVHKSRLENIQLLVYDYNENCRFIDSYRGVIARETSIDQLLNLYAEKQAKEKELYDLEYLVHQIVDCQYEIKECEKIIAKEKTINTLLTLYLEIDQQQQYYTDFNNLVNYAKSTMRKLEIAEKTYETKHEEFEKNFPDVCPLCNKPK